MTAQGKSADQIARECFVSVNTVRSTVVDARARLKANNTAHCIIIAIAREELGLDHDGNCFISISD